MVAIDRVRWIVVIIASLSNLVWQILRQNRGRIQHSGGGYGAMCEVEERFRRSLAGLFRFFD